MRKFMPTSQIVQVQLFVPAGLCMQVVDLVRELKERQMWDCEAAAFLDSSPMMTFSVW